MPTSGERKALWFFAVVALSGSAVRLWRPDPPPESPALDQQLRRVDSARAARALRDARIPRGGQRRPGDRPVRADTSPAAPLDLDRATAGEIERLPGIGPALASRIVASRDSGGSFGAMDALCDVRGVGPALAARLRPLVTFSGPRRPVSGACDEGSNASRRSRAARHRK